MARILVIDDDPDYADMLVSQFQKMGHESCCATCLAGGTKSVLSFNPDIIFLDVNLPDGSGLDCIPQYKKSVSQPEIIIVTGLGHPDGAELAIRSGAWDYVSKGNPFSGIILSLQHALEYREHKQNAIPRALDLGEIIGRSPVMKECFDFLAKAASSDANVLITGESGTGKELSALAIHNNSRRKSQDFVVVDCAAMPEKLVESMLFGHRKGAFTGATESRSGLIEQANGGTLFLDEIAELPLDHQKTFLRVIQEHCFRPVGSDQEMHSDFRLIAATNRNLHQMAVNGLFRSDLLFRLQALTIHLPPLNKRGEDIREIALKVIAKICKREGIANKGISTEFQKALTRYPWPGNVRELINALEHALLSAGQHHTLYPAHLPTEIRVQAARAALKPAASCVPASPSLPPKTDSSKLVTDSSPLPPLQQLRDETTRRYLSDLMISTRGDIDKACRISELSRSRLYSLLKQFDIHSTPAGRKAD